VEIDRQHLPEDPKVLQQMVVGLLAERDSQEQRLRQVQHLLEQLLRARYGPRRERISEHQLFLFARALGSPTRLRLILCAAAGALGHGPGRNRVC
jgi:hypothetical protein